MLTQIYIGTDELDLYDDENIVITSSIANLQDITKIYTDYSRSIEVPASNKNNKILKHWYDSKIFNGFDNRIFHAGKICLGGGDFRYGKFKIAKATKKNGRISNYTLDFVGNLIELKEKFGDDKLSDLDFSEYDFNKNSDNYIYLLENDFYFQNLFAVFLTTKQLVYDSSESIVETDIVKNIYYNGSDNNSSVLWSDLKIGIRLNLIKRKISETYNLNFSDEFLETTQFKEAKLLLNGGGKNESVDKQVIFTGTLDPDCNLTNNTITYTGYHVVLFQTVPVSNNLEYTIYIKDYTTGEILSTRTGHGRLVISFPVRGKTLSFFIKTSDVNTFDVNIKRRSGTGSVLPTLSNGFTFDILYSISANMPDMKVYDFFQGILKMFKLVAIPKDDGSIYIDTLVNFYKKGSLIQNFEKYIDISNENFKPLDTPNVINYNFEEPTTILAKEFYNNFGYYYGDKKEEIKVNDNLVEGDELNFDVPFEQMIYERLYDLNDGFKFFLFQYGLLLDENLSSVKIKPHIFYTDLAFNTTPGILDLPKYPIKLINDAGVGVEVFNINIPVHSITNYSTIFDKEIDEYTGEKIENTLYTNYHKPYIDNIVSKNGRLYTVTAKNVPTHIINTIRLNDVIPLDNVYYRINTMKVNILTRDIEFELFNDANLDLNYIPPTTFDNSNITFDSTEITFDRK